MGHQDQSAPVGQQLLLQPRHRPEVEVVGGLIEDQQLRRVGEDPGQRHPLGLAPRQRGDIGTRRRGHAQSVEGGLGLPSGTHRVAHRAGRQHRYLLEEADPRAAAPPHLTLVGAVRAGDDAQQGGLAGAVDAHHSEPVPVDTVERQVLEQHPVRRAHGDVLEIDEHGHETIRVPAPSRLAAGPTQRRPADRRSGDAGDEWNGVSMPAPGGGRQLGVTHDGAGAAGQTVHTLGLYGRRLLG